jgi:hypothetical protein
MKHADTSAAALVYLATIELLLKRLRTLGDSAEEE